LENAVVVGHDWGSSIAATSALLHPEVFRAVALLSVPYAPPGGPRPTDIFGQIGGQEINRLLTGWLNTLTG
jgi:pimeloyl-ACP methyl ester carboxylesterase